MRLNRFRSFIAVFVLILFIVSPIAPVSQHKAAATPSASQWQAGRIIDDSVFFNSAAMNTQDIQNFLSSKESGCTSNCLKDYSQVVPDVAADSYCGAISGGSMSAATIIKTVTAACSMNPQAMIVLIQKEQGLITDTAPTSYEYQFATGFCVYDTTPPPACAGTDGFFNQVYYAARQFQKYYKNPRDYNFAAGRSSYIDYNPNAGCGSGLVNIENAATAGLYNYTPYQPNQAALDAGYGTGDSCSSYGNRNFWLYFWDWFGDPIGSEYAWLIDNYSYANGDNILTKGHAETITLKARNISRHPWYNSGDHPIRLGTWNPADRTSALFPTRLATLQEPSVDINQVGTFTFQVTPQTEGTFVEPLNLVAENYTWMAWPGFSPTIIVTSNPYQWRVDSVSYGSGTGVMDVGSTQWITIRATNTGNVNWDKTSPPVWLATWPPDRSSAVADPVSGKWPSTTRITQFNENPPIAPGQQVSFQLPVYMPGTGNYYEHLNLVAEGQNWFNDNNLILYLHGKTYSWQPVWASISTGTASIPRNATFTITIKAHNNGEATWSNSGSYPVRLGTWNPANRGSALYNSSWLNSIRPTGLLESSVAPGSDGTFTFTAQAPSTPGLRHECFNPVAENAQWFNDANMCFDLNIL